MHGDADLGDYGADELFAFAHRGGGCIEDRADVGASGRDPGQLFFGQGNRAAGALGGQIVLGGTHGCKLCFQSLLQSPCYQTILRFDVVKLAKRPVGLITSAFDRQLEHRQVATIVGVRLGQGLGGGGQRCGGQHVEHLVEDLVLQPDPAEALADVLAGIELLGAGTHIARAVARGTRVAGLHDAPAAAAAQQALQQRAAFAHRAAGQFAGSAPIAA